MKKSRTGTVMNKSFSWKRTSEYRLLQWLEREVARRSQRVPQHGQSAVLAVPELGSCASSGRTLLLWAARHSQGEAQPLGAQPLPLTILAPPYPSTSTVAC